MRSYSREQWAEILFVFALQSHRHCLATAEWWQGKFVWSAPWKLANEDSGQKYPPADWLRNTPDWIEGNRQDCGWGEGTLPHAACMQSAATLSLMSGHNIPITLARASPRPSPGLFLQFQGCSHPADALPPSVTFLWGSASSCHEDVLLLPNLLPADEATPLNLSKESSHHDTV